MTTTHADAALRFLRALERGDHDSASAAVSPEVPADAMSPTRLRDVWAQLLGHLGSLVALDPIDVVVDQGRHVADFAARFARSEVTLRVVLDADARVVGFWATPPREPAYEPPPYVDRDAFREVELTVGVEPALGATLTLPREGRGWPGVVLVHGSGPNDRDERLGANRPFRDLAWGLASRGVAVLRWDKRTLAHPQDVAARGTTVDAEVVDDALAALALLRAVDGVDAQRTFVLGHSLGAMLAPEIAARDGRAAGVAMLAPPAREPAEVLLDQIEHLAASAGDDAATAAAAAQVDAMRALLAEVAARTLPGETPVLGAPASYWYELADRRPLETARALRIPILALFGGRDYQTTAADAALWRDAVAASPAAEVHELPTLDHLFREGEGIETPAGYLIRGGHVAAEVVERIAGWIAARGGAAPAA